MSRYWVARIPGRIPLAVLALLAVSPGLRAATITVTTSLDNSVADADCSLREAIVAADLDTAFKGCPAGKGADRIVFALPTLPATITLGSDLPEILESLAIEGPGADQLKIDGLHLYRMLYLDPAQGGQLLAARDLTLYRGYNPDFGGAVFIGAEHAGDFRRVLFWDNWAGNGGGAISVKGTTPATPALTLVECWLLGNHGLGLNGGGGLMATYADVTIDRTTFSSNSADDESNGDGGGMVFGGHTARIERSTFSDNQAHHSGGAILYRASFDTEKLTLIDSTITANQAEFNGTGGGRGGGLRIDAPTLSAIQLELRNTIIAGNSDLGSVVHPDISLQADALVVQSDGFNLVGTNVGAESRWTPGAPNADGDYVGAAFAEIDPDLAPLADNGGFGPTHLPLADVASPVIDVGFCSGSPGDQRGYGDATSHQRIIDGANGNGVDSDGCDIGATELGTTTVSDPLLFADDFESGTTLQWSGEAP